MSRVVLLVVVLLASLCVRAEPKVLELTRNQIEKHIGAGQNLFVFYYYEWSPKHQFIQDLLPQVARELAGEMSVAELDVSHLGANYADWTFIEHQRLRSLPAIVVYRDGKRYPYMGPKNIEKLVSFAKDDYPKRRSGDVIVTNKHETLAEYKKIDEQAGAGSVEPWAQLSKSTLHASIQDGYKWILYFYKKGTHDSDVLRTNLKKALNVLRERQSMAKIAEIDITSMPEIAKEFQVDDNVPAIVFIVNQHIYSFPAITKTSENEYKVLDYVTFFEAGFEFSGTRALDADPKSSETSDSHGAGAENLMAGAGEFVKKFLF